MSINPMFFKAVIAAGLLSLAAACATLTRPAFETVEGEGIFPYRMSELGNGMRVVTLEDNTVPKAAVHVWYHVGAKDEQPDRKGFAHMFEHMMFRGTERLGPQDHFEYIQQVGGTNNAYTAFDQTVYTQTVPANQVEMVLWLEAERMAFLKVDDEGFMTEREVVKEELRMGAESPYGTVAEKVLAEAFRGGSYSWTPGGDPEHLNQARTHELQEFWEKYYTPNNATLVVVGDVKHDEIVSMADRHFGWIPRYADKPALEVPPSEPNTEPMRIVVPEKKGPLPIVGVGFRTVPMAHDDALALEMLGLILGGGESSRLNQVLVQEKEIATAAFAGAFSFEVDGMFGAASVLAPMKSGEAAQKENLEVIRREIERIRTEGPTDRELQKAKNNFLRSTVTSQLTVGSKAQVVGSAAVLMRDLDALNRQLDDIRSVSRDDLVRVANTYLLPEREMELLVKPETGLLGSMLGLGRGEDMSAYAPVEIPESERMAEREVYGKPGLSALRPAFKGDVPPVAPPIVDAPDFETHELRLDNGLRVVVVPNHKAPFITASLRNHYGAFMDPVDAPGTAAMAAELAVRASGNYPYDEMADTLDFNAISLSASATMDSASISASAVTDQSEKAMEMLAEVLLRPAFPADQWQTILRQYRSGKAVSEKSPDYQAEKALRQIVFRDHFYSRDAQPELAEVDAITIDGMRAWWETYWRPGKTTLYMAGDVTPAEAKRLAELYLGDWSVEGEDPAIPQVTIPQADPTHIYIVNMPQNDQTQIRLSHVTELSRKDPGYGATRIVNGYFGGGFGSRLMSRVRGEEGLTYGIGGGLAAQRFGGQFIVSTFTKNESVGAALESIVGEVDRLLEEPPSERELSLIQGYIIGSQAIRSETPQEVVGDLWLIESQGLPDNYLERLMAAMRDTTAETALESARRFVNRDAMTIVLVGPAEELHPQVEVFGPVTVLDPS